MTVARKPVLPPVLHWHQRGITCFRDVAKEESRGKIMLILELTGLTA